MKRKGIIIALVLMSMVLCSACGKKNDSKKEDTSGADVTGTGEVSITETPAVTSESEPPAKATETPTPTWSPSSLKEGLITKIEYDKKYNAVVNSAEDAMTVIKMYGDMQKANYSNPAISAIEAKMEKEFEIGYVALGEIDEETAKEIYDGFAYMYKKYPELQGTLTDFSLGNFTWSAMAQTRTFEFISNAGSTPIVLKREIIISASSFLNRDALVSGCKYNEETGFWPKNASVSMIIVHELGHHLLDVHDAKLHGFTGNYVTDANLEAYRNYTSENLSYNQDEIKRIIGQAYAAWSKDNKGSEEDFRASISEYAKGIQQDGGISYTETFAEAVADIYANGENAALASKLILAAM